MKKYKTLNFLDSNENYTYINKLIILAMFIFVILNLLLNTMKLRGLEADIDNKKVENIPIKQVEYLEEKNIDLNQVKFIYSLFGTSNINEMTVSDGYVQIQGICSDLNILHDIKSKDMVKNPSVDSITKENDYYVFKLKYQAG